MTSPKVVCVVLVGIAAVEAAFVACADMVTSQTSVGNSCLTVLAQDEPVYGILLTVQDGTFESWHAPAGWSAELLSSRQLLWTTDTPIPVGRPVTGFKVTKSVSGQEVSWATQREDGTGIACGFVNLD